MTDSPIYLLDANVFIEAARRYYAFDIAPKFWESLKSQAENNRIQSIDRVQTELEKGNDHLAKWVGPHFGSAFAPTKEQEISEQYGKIMNWVQAQNQFLDYAKADFAKGADGWLIAYAIVKNRIIVTHESYDPNIRNKVLIPNVCKNFKVSFADTFEMLRALKVRFD